MQQADSHWRISSQHLRGKEQDDISYGHVDFTEELQVLKVYISCFHCDFFLDGTYLNPMLKPLLSVNWKCLYKTCGLKCNTVLSMVFREFAEVML